MSSPIIVNAVLPTDYSDAQAVVLAAPPPSSTLSLCTLADPRHEEDPTWRAFATEIYTGTPQTSLEAYRALYQGDTYSRKKIWETTQIAYGLRALGKLQGDSVGLGVGCGAEPLLYFFTRRTKRLFATDMYGFGWPGAPFEMVLNPAHYAPYDYPQERLTVLQMNAMNLLMPDATVDFVYSISSIEHFGDLRTILKHVQEAARILKPGGVLAFSTEFVLHAGSVVSVDGASFFNRTTLDWLIFNSGLERVEPIQPTPHPMLLENPATIQLPEWIVDPSERDRLSSRLADMIFTDVAVFLRKPAESTLFFEAVTEARASS